ncbi:MAG: tripartite tricarboxylate transporter substrate-binding protein [Pseudolabrys sp.]
MIVSLLGGQVGCFLLTHGYCSGTCPRRQAARTGNDGYARSDALPEIPTVGEFVPDYETSYWIGLDAPRNTPAEIVSKLNKEINAALAEPGTKSRFADIGGSVVGGSSTDFAKLVSDETEKWGKVIRAAHIKAE